MIDEQRTLELFGYTSDELGKGSHKPIIRVCDECGKYDEIIYSDYNRNKNPDLCKSCSCKGENHYNWQGGLVTLTCEICGKEFEVYPANKNRKFCSQKCMGKWQSENLSGENSSNWQGGISNQSYCKLWTEKFRQKIRDQYHNKCFLCNKSEENNANRKLSVHHVNYNKSCLCGSTCEFVPLCGSCHAKTNGNRSYWENLIMCYLYPNRYFMTDF